jgi:CheY-like chemotaxis protein
MQKRNYRILLVEDDADDRYIMQQAFIELACADDIKMFSSGDELHHYLGQIPTQALPELFVLDYHMPAINGAELALWIIANPLYSYIPVVLYSTGMNPKLRQELLQKGVRQCFEKGMHYQQVLDLVRALVEMLPGKVHRIVSEKVSQWHSI